MGFLIGLPNGNGQLVGTGGRLTPDRYAGLRLKNQLCFPLYAASREVIRHYRPHLEALDLTYTQYITMMVLWEEREISVKQLGNRLYLDSGTLTPLLKSLETKGYVTRCRSEADERVVLVRLTDTGLEHTASYAEPYCWKPHT